MTIAFFVILVSPKEFLSAAFAPASMSILTMLECPLRAACMSAVHPRGHDLSTSALCFKSSATASVQPRAAQICNGVAPELSHEFTACPVKSGKVVRRQLTKVNNKYIPHSVIGALIKTTYLGQEFYINQTTAVSDSCQIDLPYPQAWLPVLPGQARASWQEGSNAGHNITRPFKTYRFYGKKFCEWFPFTGSRWHSKGCLQDHSPSELSTAFHQTSIIPVAFSLTHILPAVYATLQRLYRSSRQQHPHRDPHALARYSTLRWSPDVPNIQKHPGKAVARDVSISSPPLSPP